MTTRSGPLVISRLLSFSLRFVLPVAAAGALAIAWMLAWIYGLYFRQFQEAVALALLGTPAVFVFALPLAGRAGVHAHRRMLRMEAEQALPHGVLRHGRGFTIALACAALLLSLIAAFGLLGAHPVVLTGLQGLFVPTCLVGWALGCTEVPASR